MIKRISSINDFSVKVLPEIQLAMMFG